MWGRSPEHVLPSKVLVCKVLTKPLHPIHPAIHPEPLHMSHEQRYTKSIYKKKTEKAKNKKCNETITLPGNDHWRQLRIAGHQKSQKGSPHGTITAKFSSQKRENVTMLRMNLGLKRFCLLRKKRNKDRLHLSRNRQMAFLDIPGVFAYILTSPGWLKLWLGYPPTSSHATMHAIAVSQEQKSLMEKKWFPPKRHKHIQKTNASTCQQIVSEYLQEMCTNTLPPKRERNIKTWDGGALERTHYIIFFGTICSRVSHAFAAIFSGTFVFSFFWTSMWHYLLLCWWNFLNFRIFSYLMIITYYELLSFILSLVR